jgi:transcriptional regulator with XRE-family HTH domain
MVKAQHAITYTHLPQFLKQMREEAGLTQRRLGTAMKKPQSWIYNCETGNRRVDVAEFIRWCDACSQDADKAFARFKRS